MSSEDLKIRARRMIEEVLNQGDLAVAHELISPIACITFLATGWRRERLACVTGYRMRTASFQTFMPSWRVNSPRITRSRS